MQKKIQQLVAWKGFERFIISLILVNGVLVGIATSESLSTTYGAWMNLANNIIISVFVCEAALKITAVAPRWKNYFGDGWNIFDFSIVVLSLLPATGELALVARMARLLRVLRLISTLPELRLIVNTLLRSLPGMGNIMLLMSVVFYIYGVAGQQFFHEIDPEHWGNLGISLLTLFRIVTLEDWTDLMYTAMAAYPYSWVFFVSFVIVGTFVIINLFIAVVIDNLDEAKKERLKELEQPVKHDDLVKDLHATKEALSKLLEQLEKKSKVI
ncbi:MAG: ion transporter [Zetaproteobacteria bacterium]|nr:ion transporter [Zetaproteobacteria bacterium]